jgi:hypothetical protein
MCCAFEVIALLGAERAAVCLFCDRRQYMKEMFDPTMAVAQQTERLVESVVRAVSNLDQHGLLIAAPFIQSSAMSGSTFGPGS